jgi:hypothetical protein
MAPAFHVPYLFRDDLVTSTCGDRKECLLKSWLALIKLLEGLTRHFCGQLPVPVGFCAEGFEHREQARLAKLACATIPFM